MKQESENVERKTINEVVSVFSSFKDKSPVNTTIEHVIEMIRSNEYRAIINKLKQCTRHDEVLAIKCSLPVVTFAGVFADGRLNTQLKSLSGCMQIDFDDLPNVEIAKQAIVSDSHTLACFISPSGKGLKVIVRIDEFSKLLRTHLRTYYDSMYALKFDSQCSDINHLCFMSYDKDAYYNENAEIFITQSFIKL
jgi:hypothetical protein